jgi:hypothetical protein
VADKILFIEDRPGKRCRHRVGFGQSIICTCRVRMLLFRLYGV